MWQNLVFQPIGTFSSVVTVLKDIEERCTAKNYHPVNLISVISKIFDKPVNNRLVDHLQQ